MNIKEYLEIGNKAKKEYKAIKCVIDDMKTDLDEEDIKSTLKTTIAEDKLSEIKRMIAQNKEFTNIDVMNIMLA